MLIQHSCGGILDHDVQFQLGIPCRFGALNTGLRQGAADAPAPIGPVDTDAELGAVAQLLLTAYGGYAGGADDFAADNSADFNTVGAGSGFGREYMLTGLIIVMVLLNGTQISCRRMPAMTSLV